MLCLDRAKLCATLRYELLVVAIKESGLSKMCLSYCHPQSSARNSNVGQNGGFRTKCQQLSYVELFYVEVCICQEVLQ